MLFCLFLDEDTNIILSNIILEYLRHAGLGRIQPHHLAYLQPTAQESIPRRVVPLFLGSRTDDYTFPTHMKRIPHPHISHLIFFSFMFRKGTRQMIVNSMFL